MKHWKQKMKYGVAVVTTTALPAMAMANSSELSADQLTAGITKGQAILVIVAAAMFGLVGTYIAYRWGRKAVGA